MSNFTVQDFAGSLLAVLAFAVVLLGPGYFLAYCCNLLDFRKKSIVERLLWAVSWSVGLVPILSYFFGRYFSLNLLCIVFEVLFVVVLLQVLRERPESNLSRREMVCISAALGGWTCFVIFSLIDVQVGHKLYFSVVEFDQSYRVAFTDAVMRTGVPPANPMYFPGHAAAMRYYYFWYVVCAMTAHIAHLTARQAFIASSVWAGFALSAIIALYVRYFLNVRRNVRRHIYIAVALTLVTGLDLLPAVGSMFGQPALNGEMEWWSIDQFSSWQDSFLWVPHHTASLCCCLFGLLLLWKMKENLSLRQQALLLVLSGAAFASAFGLSVYVVCGFAMLMACWVVYLLLRRSPELALCGRISAAGAVSLGILFPFLKELFSKSGSTGGPANKVLQFSVRRMIDPELLTALPVFSSLRMSHPILLDTGMRLFLLVPGLLLELGFYGAVLVLFWVARHKLRQASHKPLEAALFWSIAGLVIVLFIRSSVISNNDFGYRASMIPQFFLLLLGSVLLNSWWSSEDGGLIAKTTWRRNVMYGCLALGLAGTIYQGVMLRVFLPMEESIPGSGFSQLPTDAYEVRTAFAQLDRVAPRDAVVGFNPSAPDVDPRGDVVSPFTFYVRSLLMYSNRQILQAETECATEFGGDPGPCLELKAETKSLYSSPAPSTAFALAYCHKYSVSYLVLSRIDGAWNDKKGWASNLPGIVLEPGIHILRCDQPGIGYDGPDSLKINR
jgi:hypothetical protein